MAFTTIYIAPGVSPRDYRHATRARGPGVAEKRAMTELFEGAGFVQVREKDVTAAFARTTGAYLETSERHSKELQSEWGTGGCQSG